MRLAPSILPSVCADSASWIAGRLASWSTSTTCGSVGPVALGSMTKVPRATLTWSPDAVAGDRARVMTAPARTASA